MATSATTSSRLIAGSYSKLKNPNRLATSSRRLLLANNHPSLSNPLSSGSPWRSQVTFPRTNNRRLSYSLKPRQAVLAPSAHQLVLVDTWNFRWNDASSSSSNQSLVMLAMALGLAAAATATNTTTHLHAAPAEKFKGGGGGGGGRSPSTRPSIVSKEAAKDDVQSFQKDSLSNPYLVSLSAIQGARWTMEDAYTIANGGRFVAVFDGHGGDAISMTLQDRLFKIYSEELVKKHWENQNEFGVPRKQIPSKSSHVAALQRALEKVEQAVVQVDDWVYQGSTAVCVVLHQSQDGRRTLLSANVGDSRAILNRGGKAVDLTRDHKPNDEREMQRIQDMGEEVEWDPYGQVYRVRDLALSRAIGDRFAKPVVSSEPEIMHFPVAEENDEFIVLASDGLWDVMTSQEVVDFVNESLEPDDDEEESFILDKRKDMARIVANEALERGTADNVCVIIVWLKDI